MARLKVNGNRNAFLDTLAWSEGTYGLGDDGYNVLFGGGLFDDYTDHPRVRFYERKDEFIHNGKKDFTTAAGRYQITATNFDAYKTLLSLDCFCPQEQDIIALQMIRERRALKDIDAGRFEDAVKKCAPVWASLPNGCGDQHENDMGQLKEAYKRFGGTLA